MSGSKLLVVLFPINSTIPRDFSPFFKKWIKNVLFCQINTFFGLGTTRKNVRLLVFILELDHMDLLHISESQIHNMICLLVLIWWFLLKFFFLFYVDLEVWWHSFTHESKTDYVVSHFVCYTDFCMYTFTTTSSHLNPYRRICNQARYHILRDVSPFSTIFQTKWYVEFSFVDHKLELIKCRFHWLCIYFLKFWYIELM